MVKISLRVVRPVDDVVRMHAVWKLGIFFMKVGFCCITKDKYNAGKHGISLLFVIERINASNPDHSVFYATCEF